MAVTWLVISRHRFVVARHHFAILSILIKFELILTDLFVLSSGGCAITTGPCARRSTTGCSCSRYARPSAIFVHVGRKLWLRPPQRHLLGAVAGRVVARLECVDELIEVRRNDFDGPAWQQHDLRRERRSRSSSSSRSSRRRIALTRHRADDPKAGKPLGVVGAGVGLLAGVARQRRHADGVQRPSRSCGARTYS